MPLCSILLAVLNGFRSTFCLGDPAKGVVLQLRVNAKGLDFGEQNSLPQCEHPNLYDDARMMCGDNLRNSLGLFR
eukprot:1234738-Amphidinium_carterae.1